MACQNPCDMLADSRVSLEIKEMEVGTKNTAESKNMGAVIFT
ncbi:MAG: hypothetical protein HLUCCO02_12920 [Idiomarinaceae bacterium HL-53]|nr:MAG: hypothetical protein HLUCCO02_12920 [Idiomarinaceae bacterium HL-53]